MFGPYFRLDETPWLATPHGRRLFVFGQAIEIAAGLRGRTGRLTCPELVDEYARICEAFHTQHTFFLYREDNQPAFQRGDFRFNYAEFSISGCPGRGRPSPPVAAGGK